MVRLDSPKISNLSNPNDSTPDAWYWVIDILVLLVVLCKGMKSSSTWSDTTTPAACVLECRVKPSSPLAVSTNWRTFVSDW